MAVVGRWHDLVVGVHAFVDESIRASYHLVAAVVEPADLTASRALLRGLRLPGERRLHFQSEGNARRSTVLSALQSVEARAWIYVGRGKAESVRTSAFAALTADLTRVNASRLAIESRGELLDRADRLAVARSVAAGTGMTYEHLLPHEEPLLWLADAIAWCYGAGARWRPRVEPLIERVVQLADV
jgi:hypothetical protein